MNDPKDKFKRPKRPPRSFRPRRSSPFSATPPSPTDPSTDSSSVPKNQNAAQTKVSSPSNPKNPTRRRPKRPARTFRSRVRPITMIKPQSYPPSEIQIGHKSVKSMGRKPTSLDDETTKILRNDPKQEDKPKDPTSSDKTSELEKLKNVLEERINQEKYKLLHDKHTGVGWLRFSEGNVKRFEWRYFMCSVSPTDQRVTINHFPSPNISASKTSTLKLNLLNKERKMFALPKLFNVITGQEVREDENDLTFDDIFSGECRNDHIFIIQTMDRKFFFGACSEYEKVLWVRFFEQGKIMEFPDGTREGWLYVPDPTEKRKRKWLIRYFKFDMIGGMMKYYISDIDMNPVRIVDIKSYTFHDKEKTSQFLLYPKDRFASTSKKEIMTLKASTLYEKSEWKKFLVSHLGEDDWLKKKRTPKKVQDVQDRKYRATFLNEMYENGGEEEQVERKNDVGSTI